MRVPLIHGTRIRSHLMLLHINVDTDTTVFRHASLQPCHLMEVLFLVHVVPLLLILGPNVIPDGGREIEPERHRHRQRNEEWLPRVVPAILLLVVGDQEY